MLRDRRSSLTLALIGFVAAQVLSWAGWLCSVDNGLLSLAFHQRGTRPPAPRVTIVALDPDIPPAHQRLQLQAQGGTALRWRIDGRPVGQGAALAWLPWPGKNHAVVGGSVHSPLSTPGRSLFATRSSSRFLASWTVLATTAARCSKCERPEPAVKHTSASAASGCASSQSV